MKLHSLAWSMDQAMSFIIWVNPVIPKGQRQSSWSDETTIAKSYTKLKPILVVRLFPFRIQNLFLLRPYVTIACQLQLQWFDYKREYVLSVRIIYVKIYPGYRDAELIHY